MNFGASTLGIGLSLFLDDRFTRPAGKISSSLQDIIDKSGSLAVGMRNTGIAMTAMGAGLGYALVGNIRNVLEFREQLYKAKAVVGNMTDGEMNDLRNAAKAMAYEFPYTAKQVADSFVDIAKAGVTGTEGIKKVAAAAMTYAAAGDLQIGGEHGATNQLLNIAAMYKYNIQELPRLASQLTLLANKTTVEPQQIYETFQYAGSIMRNMKVPMEDALAMIGVLANMGEKASRAGTSLGNMLLRMGKAVSLNFIKEGSRGAIAHGMHALGLDPQMLINGKGDMQDWLTVFIRMRNELEKFGSVKRTAIVSEIMGKIAQRSATGIILSDFLEGKLPAGSLGTTYKDLRDMLAAETGSTGKAVVAARMQSPLQRAANMEKALFDLRDVMSEVIIDWLPSLTRVVRKFSEVMKEIVSSGMGKTFIKGLLILSAALISIGIPMAIVGTLMQMGSFIKMMGTVAKSTINIRGIINSGLALLPRLRLWVAGLGNFFATLMGFTRLNRASQWIGIGSRYIGNFFNSRIFTTVMTSLTRVMPPWLSAVVVLTAALLGLCAVFGKAGNVINWVINALGTLVRALIYLPALLLEGLAASMSPFGLGPTLGEVFDKYWTNVTGKSPISQSSQSGPAAGAWWKTLQVQQSDGSTMSLKEALDGVRPVTIIIQQDGKEKFKKQLNSDQELEVLRTSGLGI